MNSKESSMVSSGSKTVVIDRVRIIGECINPTGKPRLQQALKENDLDYIAGLAIEQVEAGADILDVNVGSSEIDEKEMMVSVIKKLQALVSAPLQIDSAKADVIEAGLSVYKGKAIINSVNGKDEVLERLLPIIKKHGAAVIGLTMDNEGIPHTAEKRLKIAEKIVNAAAKEGIPQKDIFIDCLALASCSDQETVYETLEAISLVKKHLGVKTVLGVSNVSFGMPARDTLNQVFLTLALGAGLDLPIINPNVKSMIDTVYCFHQLKNLDEYSMDYIQRFR